MGGNIQKIKVLIKKFLGRKGYNAFARFYFQKSNARFAEYASKNVEFYDRYAGKRCFIIGNGPSLKSVDLSRLKDEYTFTVNQLSRNAGFGELKTNFHIWADQRFFDLDLNQSEDRELLDVMRNVATPDNSPVVFYKWAAKDMIEQTGLDSELDVRYFGDIGMDIPTALSGEKRLDICRPLPVFSTVVHYAVCVAVYMGFSEICLLGCDCTGFISTAQAKLRSGQQTEYAYTVTENEKRRMERMYDKTSIRNELMWYAELFDNYEFLRVYCEKQGARLVNATETTLLESIPRVDFETYL